MQRHLITPSRLLFASAGLALSGVLAFANPAAAQKNKEVTIVLIEELADADVCNMSRSTVGRIVRHNIGETLTEINRKTGKLDPKLAKSWERLNDSTWRFHLVENATFHDGEKFNAEAVVKGLNRTFHNPKLFCANKAKSRMPTVKGKVVDEFTVDISLDKPAPILPVRMNIIGIASPNADQEKMENVTVGTGPYMMTNRKAGTSITLELDPNYWGKKPEVTKATFVYRSESSVRAAMVQIGEADLAPNIAVQDAINSKTDFAFLNSETTRLRIEMNEAPLNDARVREALHYALDRDALQGSVFSKDALHATHLFEPAIQGYNKAIKNRPYDQAKARALIAAAKKDGVPVDKEIVIICRLNQWPGAQEGMQAILAMYQDVGLNMKLRCLEQAQHSDMNTKPFDSNRGPILFQDQHDNANSDPAFSAGTKYGCDGVQSTLCDKDFDAMSAAASNLSPGSERIAAWEKAFTYLYTDVFADVTLFHMVGYTRVGSRISFIPSIETNTSVTLANISFN